MDKEYVFKINMSDLFQNGIIDVEKLLKDNNIDYTLEINDIIKDNDNKVIYYYTNGYSDNCLEFNNSIEIDVFNEVYPTITPMYVVNKNDFSFLSNFSGKEINDEIIEYCKILHSKRYLN